MIASRSAAVLLCAAALSASACSGSSVQGDVADPLAGVIREFRVSQPAHPGGPPWRVWLLDSGDGSRRSRILFPGSGRGDAADISTEVRRSGDGVVVARQMMLGPTDAAGTILSSEPVTVTEESPDANGDVDFHRRLVRLGIATEVVGSSSGGCTTFAAPLAVTTSQIADVVEAALASAPVVEGGTDPVTTIRLCGPSQELRAVSSPAYRLRPGAGATRSPAITYRFTVVSRRPATAAAVREAFDLATAHPRASVVHGAVAPRASAP